MTAYVTNEQAIRGAVATRPEYVAADVAPDREVTER